MNKLSKKGFNLIELIVVMAIMAILVLIAAPRYLNYTYEARVKNIVADTKVVEDKVSEYLIKSNDQLPTNATEFSISDLQEAIDKSRLYNKTGLVNSIDESQVYYELEKKYVKAETGSKLEGRFISSKGGDVYYIDNRSGLIDIVLNPGGNKDPNSTVNIKPSITLTETPDDNKMIATVTYPLNIDTIKYKIGDSDWVLVNTENVRNSISPFYLKAMAAEKRLFNVTIPYDSLLYIKATYKNGETIEIDTSDFRKSEINSDVVPKESITIEISFSKDNALNEYKLGNGPWTEYTSPIIATKNATLLTRGKDNSGNIVDYNSTIISTIFTKPVAVIGMTPDDGITTETLIDWIYDESITYNGATIINAEWQNKQSKYIAGNQTVSLRVQDSNDVWSDWVSRSFTVTAYQKPIAVITMSPSTNLTTLSNITWSYANSTAYNGTSITNIEWLNKQNAYSAGTYVVSLRVQDSNNVWSDWVSKTITINEIQKPTAVITMTPNASITTSTMITWSHTGSTAYNGETITHAEWQGKLDMYPTAGSYTVKLRVQDTSGTWSDWVSKTFTVTAVNNYITFNGSRKEYDANNAVIQTSDGGYVAVGCLSSAEPNNASEFGITKYNAAGTVVWSKIYKGGDYDGLSGIAQLTDGSIVAVGSTDSNDQDFAGKNKGSYDAYIIRISANGSNSSLIHFGGSEIDRFNDVIATSDGGYIVVGVSDSSDGSFASLNNPGGAIIFKFYSWDTVQWTITSDQVMMNEATCISKTTDGNYIIGGSYYRGADLLKISSSGAIIFEERNDAYNQYYDVKQTSDGGYIGVGYVGIYGDWHGFIAKMDTNGKFKWGQNIKGNKDDYANSVIETSDKGFIVVGQTNSTSGTFASDPAQYYDGFILKYNASGVLMSVKTFGGTQSDGFDQIIKLNNGNYLIAGKSESTNGDLSSKRPAGYLNAGALLLCIDQNGNYAEMK